MASISNSFIYKRRSKYSTLKRRLAIHRSVLHRLKGHYIRYKTSNQLLKILMGIKRRTIGSIQKGKKPIINQHDLKALIINVIDQSNEKDLN